MAFIRTHALARACVTPQAAALAHTLRLGDYVCITFCTHTDMGVWQIFSRAKENNEFIGLPRKKKGHSAALTAKDSTAARKAASSSSNLSFFASAVST